MNEEFVVKVWVDIMIFVFGKRMYKVMFICWKIVFAVKVGWKNKVFFVNIKITKISISVR